MCVIVTQLLAFFMTEIKVFIQNLLTAVLRVALWLIMAVVAVGLLAVAMVLLLLGVLWALVRGKKPVAPVFVGRFQRFTTERVWPAGPGRRAPASTDDVVDVEVREVSGSDRLQDNRKPPDAD